MNGLDRSPAADTLTDLVLELFRANNLMLAWGDRLVAPFGLTSARWQILGAIVFAEKPQPVAWLARDLGANRQNVQRVVNDLHKDGLVAFEPNPRHRRARLVVLTEKGLQTYEAALGAYYPRANALAESLPASDIRAAQRILAGLRQALEGEHAADARP